MRNSLALLGIPDLPIRAFRHIGDRRIQPQGGGTGIPIVDEVLDEGQKFVSSTSEALADVDDSISNAAADLDDTVNKEVPGGWATVINVATAGQAAPYTSAAQAAIALDKGADLEDVAKNYAISQAAGQVSSGVGASTGSQLAGNVAGSTASGVLRGNSLEDSLETGLKSGVINSGLSAGAKSISDAGLADWSQKNAEASYENAPSPTEQDVLAADPSIKMDFPLSTPTTETGSGYYNEITGEFVPSDTGVVQAPLDNTSGTNLDSVKENADLTGLSNTQSPLDTASVLPPSSDVPPEAYDPLKEKDIKAGLAYAANNLLNSPSGGATPATGTAPAPTSLSQQVYKDPTLSSEAQYLGYNTGNQNQTNEPVDPYELKQLYDSLDPRLAEQLRLRGIAPEVTASNTVDPLLSTTKLVADGGTIKSYAGTTGSSVTSGLYDSSVFNPTITKTNPNMLPAAPVVTMASRLGALKHLYAGLGSKQPHLAAGGLPSKYTEAAPKGHNPEFVTGLTGYYAQGKGTGQSDDIPAMLHDGDYVADADLVAALGDGSSKAGAEALEKFRRQIPHQESAEGGAVVPAKIADGEYVFPASFVTAIGRGDNKAGAKLLDAMREEIRAHKRSAPTSKIPPKAKSPLDYLKMVKG
jgi:hypothetical protein